MTISYLSFSNAIFCLPGLHDRHPTAGRVRLPRGLRRRSDPVDDRLPVRSARARREKAGDLGCRCHRHGRRISLGVGRRRHRDGRVGASDPLDSRHYARGSGTRGTTATRNPCPVSAAGTADGPQGFVPGRKFSRCCGSTQHPPSTEAIVTRRKCRARNFPPSRNDDNLAGPRVPTRVHTSRVRLSEGRLT
jgi:hypothetical protein